MYIKTDEINNDCDYLTAGEAYECYDLIVIDDDDDLLNMTAFGRIDAHTDLTWYECDQHGNKLQSSDYYQSDTDKVTITLSKADKDALERVLEALKGG